MSDKFIYVFNEKDRDELLFHGYDLIQEPKAKKATKKKTKSKDAEVSTKGKKKEPVVDEEEKEEVKYWVFLNKTARDMVFSKLDNYVFSDTLTL